MTNRPLFGVKHCLLSEYDNFNWLGATEDPGNYSIWWWVDGTQMTSETGWDFWDVEEPGRNTKSTCLALTAVDGEVYFNDKDCTKDRSFWCEMGP